MQEREGAGCIDLSRRVYGREFVGKGARSACVRRGTTVVVSCVRDKRHERSSHLLADSLQAHHVVRQNLVGEVFCALKLVPFRLGKYLECMCFKVSKAESTSPSSRVLSFSTSAECVKSTRMVI